MLKGLMNNFAKSLGYEIQGPSRAYAAKRTLTGLLRQERINLILDVGANHGQFADEIWTLGYKGRLISFEPMMAAHAHLRSRAAGNPNWIIADRTAIGAQAGSVEMNISQNSVSSSILEALPTLSQAEPRAIYVRSESAPVNRLDDICHLSPSDRVALKVDVQGYEREVLEGAERVLQSCRAVITEMSLVPLYKSQILARGLWDWLTEQGFDAWSLEPGFRNPQSGRMLQFDGLFIRREDECVDDPDAPDTKGREKP